MIAEAAPVAGWWDVQPRDAYYADTDHVSHSMLEVFRRSIPEFAALFVHKTLAKPEPTPAMQFGSLVHTALLEPAKWENRIVAPECDRRTKIGKAIWEGFSRDLAARPGAIAADAEDLALVEAMCAAARAHPIVAQALADEGHVERPIRWQDNLAVHQTWLKAKPDKVLASGLILDVKTAVDPSPAAWARAVTNFGYHRQAAHYLDGAWRALEADGPFMFVVIGKSPPHEVVCYVLDEPALKLGRDQNRADIQNLAQCYASGQWGSRWPEVQLTTLPRYAFYD